MEILLSTGNQGKIKEIKHFFKDLDITFLSLTDFPNAPKVIEDKETLEENAIKKAKELMQYTKKITLADDSGLEVDALNGEPGVYSARYAGENATYHDNNMKLLQELKNVPKQGRTAHFRTVLALAYPNGQIKTVQGLCRGIILEELRGEEGFGYDPLFFIPKLNKTFAEMTLTEKNQISHRSQALKKLHDILKSTI